MDECGEKNAISLSWGRREIRISGEGATLYVNGVPHDMTHDAGDYPWSRRKAGKDTPGQMDLPVEGTAYRAAGM